MYIAQVKKSGQTRFAIRESVSAPQQDWLISRELFDLGDDPAVFIHYAGRDNFYIGSAVAKAVLEKNPGADLDKLDELFYPFLNSEARYRAEYFGGSAASGAASRKLTETDRGRIKNQLHLFDKRRLHYLRYGSLSQTRLHKAPLKMFRPLLNKSRDELEQYFIAQEQVLEPVEFCQYVYVIFDLQKHFTEAVAQSLPGALDRDKLDTAFEEEFCRLIQDRSFFADLGETELAGYLGRYAVMFFDYGFDSGSIEDDFIRQFMNSRRTFRFPESKIEESYEEAGKLLGVSVDELKKMGSRELTKLYRKSAHDHHPDKGGEHDRFVRLNKAYERLLKKKKG